MLDAIIERIRGRWRRHVRAEEVARPEARGPAADAAAVPLPAVGKAPAVEAEGPALSAALREELARRTEALRTAHAAHAGNEDALSVLDRVIAPGALIRQPPAAAQAVLQMCRRPYGADAMIGLIERDPALSQSLLRHANSAWYGGSSLHPILALKPAIQRLGTQGIHATVMFEVLQGELARPGGGFDPWVRMVWEHMVRSAPIAREHARAFGVDAEEAFTLALLHDVGKLVFFDRIAAERKRLRRDVRVTGIFVSDALAALHEVLGGIALLEWGVDARAAAAVAGHHRRGSPPRADGFAEVLFLAEQIDLARQRKGDVDLDRVWRDGALTGDRAQVAASLARPPFLRHEPCIHLITTSLPGRPPA